MAGPVRGLAGRQVRCEVNTESAQGIELAVMGEGGISGFDSSPISRLIDMHIADIQAIADSFRTGEDDS
jgi:hypothetical protein